MSLIKNHVKSLVKSLVKSFLGDISTLSENLLLLYSPVYSNDSTVSKRGVNPSYAYAGEQFDAEGVSVGEVPAVHDDLGVWVGPSYKNVLPPDAWSFHPIVVPTPWTLVGLAGFWAALTVNSASASQRSASLTVAGLTAETSYRFTIRIQEFTIVNPVVNDGFRIEIEATGLDIDPAVNGVYCVSHTTGVGETTADLKIVLQKLGNTSVIGDSMKVLVQVTEAFCYPYTAPDVTASSAAGSLTNGVSFLMGDELINLFRQKVYENHMPSSEDYENIWNTATLTLDTTVGDFTRAHQISFYEVVGLEKNFIFTSEALSTMVGKDITTYFRVRAISSDLPEKTFVNLRLRIFSNSGGELYSTPKLNVAVNIWQTIRVPPLSITDNDLIFIVENYDAPTCTNLVLDLDYVMMAESLTPALYNTGDSMQLGSFVQGGNGSVPSLNYSALVADELGIEYVNNAKGNAMMADILSEATTEFASLPSGTTYPMVFFDGGAPEFMDNQTVAFVKAGLILLIAEMVANCDNCLFMMFGLGPGLDDLDYLAEVSGVHEGGASPTILTDTKQAWTVDALIGLTINNVTDSSSGTISDNDATTLTVTLTGGTNDSWEDDDEYLIDTPVDTLYQVGLEFNEWVVAQYASESKLTLIDPNDVLNKDYVDYSTRDGRHWTTTGHAKVANLVLAEASIPYVDIEQREYALTEGTPIIGETSNKPMTTVALVTMGVDSADITATLNNILSVIDGTESLLQYNSTNIVESSDDGGVSSIVLPGTVSEKVEAAIMVQANADGDEFRVGYSTDMTSITWLAYATYDGSFNPLDSLRLGYGSTVPLWIKQVQVWNKIATDEDIIAVLSDYSG